MSVWAGVPGGGGDDGDDEPEPSAAALLDCPRHRLAFEASPRRPPAFACDVSPDGRLHVAVAEGDALSWTTTELGGGGAPLPAAGGRAAVPVALHGHSEAVTALALLSPPLHRRTLLVSASAADVLLWLGPSFHEAVDKAPSAYRCIGLLSPAAEELQPIQHVALCAHEADVWFSAAAEREIVVGLVPGSLLRGAGGSVRTHCRLAGHTAAVAATAFVPATGADDAAAPLLLASASEDRTLKLWDISSRCFIYSTPIVSTSAFTSLAADPPSGRVAAGSADGKLRIYAVAQRGAEQPGWCLECVATVSLAPKAVALHSTEHQRAVDETPEDSVPVVDSAPPAAPAALSSSTDSRAIWVFQRGAE